MVWISSRLNRRLIAKIPIASSLSELFVFITLKALCHVAPVSRSIASAPKQPCSMVAEQYTRRVEVCLGLTALREGETSPVCRRGCSLRDRSGASAVRAFREATLRYCSARPVAGTPCSLPAGGTPPGGWSDHARLESFLDGLAALAEPVAAHFLWRPQLRNEADEWSLEAAVNGQALARFAPNQPQALS